ncbi:MAG: hypothetical protein JWP78_3249 [Mucilaginibacter sp.]|nr:hypothetical protein [Mucilaginibacter sp.]
MSIIRLLILLFVWICIFLLCSGSGNVQKVPGPITLGDEKLNFTPREFYIAEVADERSDRNSVALLIDHKDVPHSPVKVDLKGGVASAVKNFVYRNLRRDTAMRPVMVSIKEFKLTETNLPGGRVGGHLAVVFSFALQLSYRSVHLVDYRGGIRYNRPDSQAADAEAILRHGIEDALSYFNTWINSQAGHNPLLATAVKVSFTDYSEKPEGDTIYYSVNRPLTWADFKDRPRESRFEAQVFTSIGYTERTEVIKGVIHLDMAIKVDLAKSDCWVKAGSHDDYILNHEQRHFDIEKLVSEHFKKKILAMDLPTDNFDGPINVEYLETLREATAVQRQYDAETRHGQDRQAQERWNEKIDKELKAYGLKND